MSSLAPATPSAAELRVARRRLARFDLRANRVVVGLCLLTAILVFLTMFDIVYQVINGASPAIARYGLAFLVHTQWLPNEYVFGAWPFILGTLLTSVISVCLSTTLGIAIGLFLALFAPRWLAAIVGPLVEMLAAVPSIILGFIGLILIAPFIARIEPGIHSVLGWIPFFGAPQTTGLSIFTASLVLTIMVVPIVSALSRDLFLTVPRELVEGAEALGATRWEVIRGIVLPTTSSGVVSACVLGFGRALGEAIAVSLVVGSLAVPSGNGFAAGDTLAANIANQFTSPDNPMHTAALYYLALILFVFSMLTNLLARRIAGGLFRRRSRRGDDVFASEFEPTSPGRIQGSEVPA